MRPTGMTVALAMYWLAGVVGAASLPSDDQYSPQQPPYKRDAVQGPRGFQNWLEYHQDSSTGLKPPENKPGITSLRTSDLLRERKTRKDSVIRDSDLLSLAPEGWNIDTASVMTNFTGLPHPEFDVPEEGFEISSASREDPFETDDTFQDQGPGSVEVYKLDLRRENSLLAPQAKRKQPGVVTRIKSKIPKKAREDEILWKLKPIEPSKTSLAAISRLPSSIYRGESVPRESRRKIEEDRKAQIFAVGGVPELQVGCEGLETSDRKRRSSGPGEEDSDEEYWPKFKDPVYKESTEPILLRITPIVLDFEDEPPAGQIYEELDELLKLKSTTTPEPTTKRTNRGDIDPALENYQHREVTLDEKLPERGDLGPNGSKDSSRVERSIQPEDSQSSKVEDARFPRDANREDSPLTTGVGGMNDDTSSQVIGSRSESLNHRSGRKLLWVQYPERQEDENQARTSHHREINEHQRPNLWGFGEDDGEISGNEDESDADKLRQVEEEKRRREYERRRQEDLEKRRGGHGRHHPHSQEDSSRTDKVHSEIERIRKEYERDQEKEQRERQRIEEERRRQGERGHWEDDQRRNEEAKRRQSEESRRRVEEEEKKNRDHSYSRAREEDERRKEWNKRREEEERRIRLEDERNNRGPPSPLTRSSPDNRSGSQQVEKSSEAEEQKLRKYIERNRPIDVKKNDDRRKPEDETKRRNDDEERRERIVEAHRRRQMEEERRRQQAETERKRQMEEHQRRQESPDEDERKRQIEYQMRRDQPGDDRANEDSRRRRLEEEKKLQEYVRRNQPVNVPRRNSSEERDWQEQRRTINDARQWEHNRQQITRTNSGRSHGPSAPTNIGQRQSQGYLEELRRRQETERFEAERRKFQEEGRRREEEYQREESRRYEEERLRLEAARRREEPNRRRTNWQDSRRPTSASRGGEIRDHEAGELRKHETPQRIPSNSRRNQDEWRRRSEERERQRQQQQHEERERLKIEHERNYGNNGRQRPQHEDTGLSEQRQRSESVRSKDEVEKRRREEARLSALPVSARIIVHSDKTSSRGDGTLSTATILPPSISIGSRDGFDNGIDFPAINPNRPGLQAARFPAPATRKPPSKSPSACVWAIVNCCSANNRLTTCFESMGCPGVNWDPSPCRASIQSAARAQVVRFYESAENN